MEEKLEEKIEIKVPWESIAPLLGTWASRFRKFYDKGGFNDIYKVLKLTKASGKQICPEAKNVFNCFKQCPVGELKTVFFGLSPYPHIINGITCSDGLTFSCKNTGKEQPSLKLIWDAVKDDIYTDLDIDKYRNPDLQFWAKQGVLLANAALTCEKGRPDSHLELWKPFWKYFYDEIMSGISGVVFVFFGKEAAKYNKLVTPFIHYSKIVEHPAFAARCERPFEHDKLFSYINNILRSNNGTLYQINWIELDDLPF